MAGEGGGLDRDNDEVLRLQLAGPVGGDRVGDQLSVTGLHPQSVLPDRGQLLTTGDQRQLGLGSGEASGDVPAHGPRSVHADFHVRFLFRDVLFRDALISRTADASAPRRRSGTRCRCRSRRKPAPSSRY